MLEALLRFYYFFLEHQRSKNKTTIDSVLCSDLDFLIILSDEDSKKEKDSLKKEFDKQKEEQNRSYNGSYTVVYSCDKCGHIEIGSSYFGASRPPKHSDFSTKSLTTHKSGGKSCYGSGKPISFSKK